MPDMLHGGSLVSQPDEARRRRPDQVADQDRMRSTVIAMAGPGGGWAA